MPKFVYQSLREAEVHLPNMMKMACFLNLRKKLWLLVVSTCIGYGSADVLVFSMSDSTRVEENFRDAPARFGGFIPIEGIKGFVVYAEPATACQDIRPPPPLNITTDYNMIVLIARMNCSFETKIRTAQRAGYDAAIVHNVGSDDLEPMSAKGGSGILIPSVFVGEHTGLFIKENFLYDKKFFVMITEIPLNINTHLLLPFAIVVIICFLVMVIFMIIRCIKDRRRQRRHRLPNSSLKKIPTHKYTKGDPYETCAICLDDYAEGDKLRVLPCAHAYHTKCIDPWLTKNRRVCPVCKRKVFAADERVETDSESDSDADDTTPLIRTGNSGTQGGTFTTRTENLFARVPRTAQRRDSNNSGSSMDSNQPIVVTSDDGESVIGLDDQEFRTIKEFLRSFQANVAADMRARLAARQQQSDNGSVEYLDEHDPEVNAYLTSSTPATIETQTIPSSSSASNNQILSVDVTLEGTDDSEIV